MTKEAGCGVDSPCGASRALVVMTRAPEPGATKTRMMPDLTPQQCAELHRSVLRDLREMCNDLPRGVDVFVAFAPEGARERVACAFRAQAEYIEQRGSTLGQRMDLAAREIFSRGYDRVALVGSDAPEVRAEDVLRAFSLLDGCDVVLGPSGDGGYYLVASAAPHAALFGLEAYGHAEVLEQTQEALARAGLSHALIRTVADIDCWNDAQALLARASSDEHASSLAAVAFLRGIAR